MAISQLSDSGFNGTKYGDIMAGNTWMEPIATQLVGSGGASSIVFSNIPQGYTHLHLRYIARTNYAPTNQDRVQVRFNGDTGTNYAWHRLVGDGATVSGTGYTSESSIMIGVAARAGETANVFGAGICDVLDYTNQNKYKTVRCLTGEDANSGSDEYVGLQSGLWLNTSPITSITIYCDNGSWVQNSRFSLYGLRG